MHEIAYNYMYNGSTYSLYNISKFSVSINAYDISRYVRETSGSDIFSMVYGFK